MKLAAIRFSALGDIAATLPTLRALPHKPTIITMAMGKALLEDEFDDFLILENKKIRSVFRLVRQMRQRRFEAIFDYQSNDRSKAMTPLSGARYANSKNVDISPGAALIHHQVTQKIFPDLELDITFSPKPRDYLVFNIGSSEKWASKRLPTHKWHEFAHELFERYQLPIRFIGAREEYEYVENTTRHLDIPHENLAGKTSLQELKAVLDQAFLTVSTDSAAMHLSAAQKTPTIGLFGATSWMLANPFGPWSTALHAPGLACPGQSQEVVPKNIYDGIDIREGLNRIEAYLGQPPFTRPE